MEKDAVKIALKQAIYQRRSTRAYTAQPVPDELIEEILDAGRHAPTGMNRQKTHFFVITNAEKLAELKSIIAAILADMTVKEEMPPTLKSMIERAKKGALDVTHGAPVLIVTAGVKGAQNTIADCTCALQNMMLTAAACGLGACWVNQFFAFRDAPTVKEFFAGIGVAEDEEICGSVVVGYAENLQNEPLPRTGYPVTYIR